jgi:hypothetical protein
MKGFSIAAVAACLLVQAGCESAPARDDELRAVPAERILASPAVQSRSPARIAFVRDAGGTHPHFWRISIDGEVVAKIDKAEFVVLAVEPGQRQFRIDMDRDPPERDFRDIVEVTLAPGVNQVYRIGSTFESKIQLTRDPLAKMPR